MVASATGLLILTVRVTRGLPGDLGAVASGGSADTSVIRDRDGGVLERFHLVEALGPREVVPEIYVDAFLAAASPAFYESRTDDALPLREAIGLAWRRDEPDVSPLSAELATLLLRHEPAGFIRRAREAIVATRLDAFTALSVRVTAWLERQPLCWGRRGLKEAAERCIVVPEKDRSESPPGSSPGEAAVLGVAAAWGMDLVEDPALLQARRDAALQRLVARAWIDGEQVAAAVRVRARRPELPGALVYAEEVCAQVRHGFDVFDPRVLDIETPLLPAVQKAADADEGLRGGAWVVLDAADGDVVAAGGDLWLGLDAPLLRVRLGFPLPTRITALGLAELGTALAAEGLASRARWVGAVATLGSPDDVLAPPPPPVRWPAFPATEAAVLRGRWDTDGEVATLRDGDLRLAIARGHVFVLRKGPAADKEVDVLALVAALPGGAKAP